MIPRLRREIEQRPGSPCPRCGSHIAVGKDGACYECKSAARGSSLLEKHHLFPELRNGPTVYIPGNTHRVITDRQRYRDNALRHESDNPIISLASMITSAAEHCEALSISISGPDWLITAIRIFAGLLRTAADFILILDSWLEDRLGAGWYGDLIPVWASLVKDAL